MLAEDDENLRVQLVQGLGRNGFEVYAAEAFDDLAGYFRGVDPQIAILDVKLPFYDGFYWCREIRRESSIPIVMLSSRDTGMDTIMGLSVGADEYIAKPVELDVLVAKLRAVLRRAYDYRDIPSDLVRYGELVLDQSRFVVSRGGCEAELSKNEMAVLRALIKAAGRVVSRDSLMTALWSNEIFVDDNTLNVNVARLRTKLRDLGLEDSVQTLKGEGYKLV